MSDADDPAESSSLNCPGCGARARPGTKYCETCGVTLDAERVEPVGSAQPPAAGEKFAFLQYRDPLSSTAPDVRTFLRLVRAAAWVVLAFDAVAFLRLGLGAVLLLLITAILWWPCLITVPRALRSAQYHRARRSLFVPAFVGTILFGVLPGILLIAALVKSSNLENVSSSTVTYLRRS